MKVINSSDFSIPIEKVYAVLGNPEHPDIFKNDYNDSCIKKMSKLFTSKNIKIENKELHVNLLEYAHPIESSKSISISLKDKLISDNLCCTLAGKNEDFCLLVKTIYVQAESGKTWELSARFQTYIQEYTYSLQIWKQSRKLLEGMIKYYNITNGLTDEGTLSAKEIKEKALTTIEKNLGL